MISSLFACVNSACDWISKGSENTVSTPTSTNGFEQDVEDSFLFVHRLCYRFFYSLFCPIRTRIQWSWTHGVFLRTQICITIDIDRSSFELVAIVYSNKFLQRTQRAVEREKRERWHDCLRRQIKCQFTKKKKKNFLSWRTFAFVLDRAATVILLQLNERKEHCW